MNASFYFDFATSRRMFTNVLKNYAYKQDSTDEVKFYETIEVRALLLYFGLVR